MAGVSLSRESQLVSWCFKPSQPQRITSGLNTNFTLSPSQSFHKSSYHKVILFQPFYIPRALNTGTCIHRVTYFILRAYTGTMCQTQPTQGKIGRGFAKNAGEWTGSVEISKEEIPGSKRSMYGYILTYSSLLKGERLRSVFSPDGTLISASAAPHCGDIIIAFCCLPWSVESHAAT